MRIFDVRALIANAGFRPQCLVRIETDDGIVGWGESGLLSREQAVAGAVAHFRSFLIGADPMARGAIWQRLYRSQYFEGGRVLTAALAAIDIALYDVVGKALNVPVYDLIGGRHREFIPLFATTSAPTGPSLVEDAQALIKQGFDVIRFLPGSRENEDIFEPRDSVAITAEWAVNLRAAVGPDPTLGIEFHHRLSIAEAVAFCQRMPSGTLDFIEEPIRAESPDAYAQLRSMVDIPFAVGEEFSSKWAFAPFIERGLIDLVRIDICNVGGFTEAAKVAGWAETHYLDVMPHNPLGPIGTAATAHLCVATPNLAWMEIRHSPTENTGIYDRVVFPVQQEIHGPRLLVSSAPGLGVEVNESLLTEPVDTNWSQPQWRRRDGSVQNW